MILKIKNMESSRCKTLVKHEMKKLDLQNITVESGEVKFDGNISNDKLQQFDSALKSFGLELLIDKSSRLVAEIKDAVHQLIYFTDDFPRQTQSDYIIKKVNAACSYSALSNIFSQKENITLEKYIITQRIERVKELLIFSDLSINDIAFKMNFSSVAHLSNQFKKVTGLTPSFYRKNRNT